MQFAYVAVCVPSDSSLIPKILDMPGLKASCLISGFLIACNKEVHTEEMEEGGREFRLLPTCCTTTHKLGKSLGMGL